MVMVDLSPPVRMASGVARSAWLRNDPELERDAIDFWRRLGILPAGVAPEDRVKELCGLIYVGGELAALSTATLETVTRVRARMAVFRIAVARDHRGAGLAIDITETTKEIIERWSIDNPQEKVMGLAAIIHSEGADWLKNRTVWPTGMELIGYTPTDHQLRVFWFDHARLDQP